MKKAIRVFCLMLALLTAFASIAMAYPVESTMQVVITATCADTNSVGDEWYEYYELNGYEMLNGDVIDFRVGDVFELFSQITEDDMINDDIGTCAATYQVTPDMMVNGFTIDQYLTVMEDSGIHKGYWCEWYINFEFIPVY